MRSLFSKAEMKQNLKSSVFANVLFSPFEVGPSQIQVKLGKLTICFGVERKTGSFADLRSLVFF